MRMSPKLLATIPLLVIAVLLESSPALALVVTSAKVKRGAVEVKGRDANPRSGITWEGQVATQANPTGRFKFTTTTFPLDCVGTVSDGVESIPAIIESCSILGVCVPDADFTSAHAVGLGKLDVRLSGVQLDGERFVVDFAWTGTGLQSGTSTPSAPPTIGDLTTDVVPGDATCPSPFEDRLTLAFSFSDPNADVFGGGVIRGDRVDTLRSGGTCLSGARFLPFLPSVPSACSIAPAHGPAGAITCSGCFVGVSRTEFAVSLVDADGNESGSFPVGIDIPAAPSAAARDGFDTRDNSGGDF